MKIINVEDSNMVELPGRRMWALLDAAKEPNASMSACLIQIPPRDKVRPAHAHSGSRELIYIISGAGTITVNAQVYRVKPGTALLIEAGEVHALANESEGNMEAFCVFVPPCSLESYQEIR
jgi:quercetin dioxygenase-like cupin family protein